MQKKISAQHQALMMQKAEIGPKILPRRAPQFLAGTVCAQRLLLRTITLSTGTLCLVLSRGAKRSNSPTPAGRRFYHKWQVLVRPMSLDSIGAPTACRTGPICLVRNSQLSVRLVVVSALN